MRQLAVNLYKNARLELFNKPSLFLDFIYIVPPPKITLRREECYYGTSGPGTNFADLTVDMLDRVEKVHGPNEGVVYTTVFLGVPGLKRYQGFFSRLRDGRIVSADISDVQLVAELVFDKRGFELVKEDPTDTST